MNKRNTTLAARAFLRKGGSDGAPRNSEVDMLQL